MTKYFFFFVIIVAVVFSFKIELNQPADLQACAPVEINTAITSISKCDQADQGNTTDCIVNTLNDTLNEKWDALTRSVSNTDGLYYWTWNLCNLTYNNYGKYNRSFVLWTAINYTYFEQRTKNLDSKKQRYMGESKSNQCTDW